MDSSSSSSSPSSSSFAATTVVVVGRTDVEIASICHILARIVRAHVDAPTVARST
jgi:hypothetical protein